ncbi:MAG: fumarylacetoacetate hydrolase family protein [Acidimicrobiia bacterium]
MKLIAFDGGFGRLDGDTVIPLGASLDDHLAGAPLVEGAARPLRDVGGLRAPVRGRGKILCIGLNYRDHAAETGMAIPTSPIVFAKWCNAVVGPDADVEVPLSASDIDYEAELAVVVGQRARRVQPDDALDYVAGYLCANDVSARAQQFAVSQWTLGKAIDTFLPLGPWLVTSDEVPDPQALGIRCLVNGEKRQDSSTGEMIFGVAELLATLSQTITLEPGDLIVTGTPAGVGMALDPPRYLSVGDEVTVEIDGLGSLTNRIRAA